MDKELYLYYDGACHLCSKEMIFYKQKDPNNLLGLIDITTPDFDPLAEGIPEKDFKRYFHVKRANGEILSGVTAFQSIWDELEIMPTLSTISKTKLGFFIMNAGYYLFALGIRPYLPKKNTSTCKI